MVAGDDLVSRLFTANMDLILRDIFLFLDPGSLKASRCVSHQWNSFILETLWGSRGGRRRLEEQLQHRWRSHTGASRVVELGCPSFALWRSSRAQQDYGQQRVTSTAMDSSRLYCAVGLRVRVYCLASLEKEKTLHLGCSCWGLAVSQTMLVVSEGERLRLYSKAGWAVLHTLVIPNNLVAPCTNIVSHGDSVVYYCKDGSLSLLFKEDERWRTRSLLPSSQNSIDYMNMYSSCLVMGDNNSTKVTQLQHPEGLSMQAHIKLGCVEAILAPSCVIGVGGEDWPGITVWDFHTGKQVRHIIINREGQVHTYGSVEGSLGFGDIVSNGRQVAVLEQAKPETLQQDRSVFLCDLEELTDSGKADTDLWVRAVMSQATEKEGKAMVVLMNKTNLVVRTISDLKDNVNILDLWSGSK